VFCHHGNKVVNLDMFAYKSLVSVFPTLITLIVYVRLFQVQFKLNQSDAFTSEGNGAIFLRT